MSLSIQLLQQLFEEKDRSEPHTPIFNAKAGSLDKFEFLISQIEELKQQNLELQQSLQTKQSHLKIQLQHNHQINQELKGIEQQIHNEIIQNKLLTFNYVKKHESCFELKKQLQTQQNSIVSIPDLNTLNRPSDCSTAPSPGMQKQLQRGYKKVSSVIFTEF